MAHTSNQCNGADSIYAAEIGDGGCFNSFGKGFLVFDL
jgi:hypothetical protein